MSTPDRLKLDTVIFGGGAAGLWLLDALVRLGHRAVLLESDALGAGQTIASQGIIHGGMKYSLSGWLSASAEVIREMPERWRESLRGAAPPDLSNTTLRAEHCYLWHTQSLRSRVAMTGARLGLAVQPIVLESQQRPAVLAECPGAVARLDEPVIDPPSFLADLAHQHQSRVLKIDKDKKLNIHRSDSGGIDSITLPAPNTEYSLQLHPANVVFTAGAGNERLLRAAGFDQPAMQRRGLHMVVARGDLPAINGHCVDGRTTRVTVTSTTDSANRTIWQIGGQVAENGVNRSPAETIHHTFHELQAVIPGLDLSHVEWMTYRVDRAEASRAGRRPDDVTVAQRANVITAWPTKLALVPKLAAQVMEKIGCSRNESEHDSDIVETFNDWPRPNVARPPWETNQSWITDP